MATQSLASARKYELHKCGHAPGQCTAAQCIKDQIGELGEQSFTSCPVSA